MYIICISFEPAINCKWITDKNCCDIKKMLNIPSIRRSTFLLSLNKDLLASSVSYNSEGTGLHTKHWLHHVVTSDIFQRELCNRLWPRSAIQERWWIAMIINSSKCFQNDLYFRLEKRQITGKPYNSTNFLIIALGIRALNISLSLLIPLLGTSYTFSIASFRSDARSISWSIVKLNYSCITLCTNYIPEYPCSFSVALWFLSNSLLHARVFTAINYGYFMYSTLIVEPCQIPLSWVGWSTVSNFL